MQCPKCGVDAFCVNTRQRQDGVRRRRYECQRCEYRFSTLEFMIDYGRRRMIEEFLNKIKGVS